MSVTTAEQDSPTSLGCGAPARGSLIYVSARGVRYRHSVLRPLTEMIVNKQSSTHESVIAHIDSLAGLRDELHLQAHLFQAEARDRWQEAETRWSEMQRDLRDLRTAAAHSRDELAAALALTAEALRKSYQDLREATRTR